MRARIGMALGHYWGGIVYAIDVLALISALGAIGGLPVLLKALTKYTRFAMRWWRDLRSRTATASVCAANETSRVPAVNANGASSRRAPPKLCAMRH
jgi:hypothetical protein